MVRQFRIANKVLNFSAERFLRTAGHLFIYDGDYDNALTMVEKTLEIDPTDKRALVLRGDILFCLNRDIEALQTLVAVTKLHPNSAEAYLSISGIFEAHNKLNDALHACEKGFEALDEHNHYLLTTLYDQQLTLLVQMKRFRQAKNQLQKSMLQLDEADSQMLFHTYQSAILQGIRNRRKQIKENVLKLKVITS